jgi:hypothetical protein
MSRKNRNALADRVVRAAKAALAAQGYVSPIDVLVGIGWLDARTMEYWRRGQIDCLERAAGAVAATNDKVCWSSRWCWRTCSTTSEYSDASNIISFRGLSSPKAQLPDRIERTTLRLTPRPKV